MFADESIKMFVLMYGLLFIFYIPFLVYIRKRKQKNFARKRFYRGVVSILNNCNEDDDCISQIQLLFKRLAERYSRLDDYFHSASEMLEDLIFILDTNTKSQAKAILGKEPNLEIRPRVISIYNRLKEIQPFSNLSSREGNLLNIVKQAIDNTNRELALVTLRQLSDSIEVLEGNLKNQINRNYISFIISVVGVILTLFFGLISFIQFFSR